VFETTNEHVLRAAVDAVGSQRVSFRVGYEHAVRTGSGLDEEVLDDIGEQVSLRQFDISNRNRDRVTATVQVTPVAPIALIGTAQVGRDDRPEANFGLQSLDTNGYSLGVEVSPWSGIGAGVTWGYEDAATSQQSRQANPGVQFQDPTRDWFTDVDERVHYVVASVDVTSIRRTTLRGGFDWNRSNTVYDYRLPPNTALGPIVPLPRVRNALRRASVDVSYALTSRLSAGLGYAYDDYDVDDFQHGPQYAVGSRSLADGLVLGYFLRPYSAHTSGIRLTLFW
jgi:opacity protein-like surface antigen